LATNRKVKPITSIKEAIISKGEPIPRFNRESLINSFPKELINKRYNQQSNSLKSRLKNIFPL